MNKSRGFRIGGILRFPFWEPNRLPEDHFDWFKSFRGDMKGWKLSFLFAMTRGQLFIVVLLTIYWSLLDIFQLQMKLEPLESDIIDIDDDDDELLKNTIFSFNRRSINASASRNVNYKPEHTFEKLISSSQGPTSILANDEFWKVSQPTQLNEFEDGRSRLKNMLEDELSYDIPVDQGIKFNPEIMEHIKVEVEAGVACSSEILKLCKLLLKTDKVDPEEAMELLFEGVVTDLAISFKEPHILIDHFVNTLFNLTDDSILPFIFDIINRFLTSNNHLPSKSAIDNWDFHLLLNRCHPNSSSFKMLLFLYPRILNSCPLYNTKEKMQLNFDVAVRLAFDNEIYEKNQNEIRSLLNFIVDWLDVPRIHLIIDWIYTDNLSMIFDHYQRPIRLARMLRGSILGSLAGKIILDCFLFPLSDGRRDMNEGDDYEFIVSFRELLDDCKIMDGHSIISIHPKLCISYQRLLLTLLEKDYNDEIAGLISSISRLRSSIPPSHYSVNISSRDLLSKMDTYLKSYLLKSKLNREGHLLQLTLDQSYKSL